MNQSWLVDVQENENGELYIQLPEEVLEKSGFKPGDSFYWQDIGDGSFMLIKEDLTTFINKGIINNEQD